MYRFASHCTVQLGVSQPGCDSEHTSILLTLDLLNQVSKGAAFIVLEVLGRHSVLALLRLVLLCLQGQIQVWEQVGVLGGVSKGLCCLGVDLGQLLAPQLDHLQQKEWL